MTLGRQLILSGMLVILGLFAGMILFTVQNTQQFLNMQLATHSKDTATVLGLSLSHVMENNDEIIASRMIDSIWDSGYYQHIEVVTTSGAPLVSRDMDVRVFGVPDWFIDLIPLKTKQEEALIQSGWNQVGKVRVESNPGFAYKQIWETFTDSVMWLCIITVIAIVLGASLLHVILKPLREITKQAYAICNQEFMIQEHIPWTIDLKQVVVAMNKMSSRLKTIFEEHAKTTEELREQAFKSPVTGIGNRRYFNMQFDHLTQDVSRGRSGVLLLIELHNFKGYNDEHGYEKGDALLKATADMVKEIVTPYEDDVFAHLGGANFAVLIPRRTLDVGKEIAAKIVEGFREYQAHGIADIQDVGHIGVCEFHPEELPREILSKADVALRKAQNQGPNEIGLHDQEVEVEKQGAREWAQMFDDVIARSDITLHFQPFKIFHTLRDEVFYEALLRLKDESGELIPAGQFMPMAERLQKIPAFDRIVIEKICSLIKSEEGKHIYSLNVSASSLEEEDFRKYLVKQIKGLGKQAKSIIVELPEYGVLHRTEMVRDLFRQIRKLGGRTAIDHYGQNFASFAYLHSLSVNILKIDGSFVRGLTHNPDNQFFIRSLINIAHSLDIQVIAESVETEEEMKTLKHLKIDGIQGWYLGKPQETIEDNSK